MFTVVDDIPKIEPVAINLPCFKELYLEDTTPDKSKYSMQLAYIYHMASYDSVYYDSPNKEDEVGEAFMGSKRYRPTGLMRKCIEECHKRQSNAERRALDSALIVCDLTSESALTLRQNNSQLEKLLKEIDAEIKQCETVGDKIELMKSRQFIEKNMLDNISKASEFIGKLKTQVEQLVQMRSVVAKAMADIESNKDAISHFIVDAYIDKYN